MNSASSRSIARRRSIRSAPSAWVEKPSMDSSTSASTASSRRPRASGSANASIHRSIPNICSSPHGQCGAGRQVTAIPGNNTPKSEALLRDPAEVTVLLGGDADLAAVREDLRETRRERNAHVEQPVDDPRPDARRLELADDLSRRRIGAARLELEDLLHGDH